MTSILLAGPAGEPVSLTEARAFLRVDDTGENTLISTLITAARVHVESMTRRALISQNWRVLFDGWPAGGEVRLPLGPFAALIAVRVYDLDGAPTELALAQFLPETGSVPARLILPATIQGAPVMREHLAVEIDYTAGYGSAATDVPARLRQAMLALVGHWFENREAVLMAGSGAVVPAGFDDLVQSYRVLAL